MPMTVTGLAYLCNAAEPTSLESTVSLRKENTMKTLVLLATLTLPLLANATAERPIPVDIASYSACHDAP